MKTCPLPASDASGDAWAEHLQDVLRSLRIPSGTLADNVAASVAMYCRRHHPQGLHAAELRLLVARAFCAVGEEDLACRVLESMDAQRRHVSRWLEVLGELHHFPDLLPYFSRGIIRPADWAGARHDRMWTLDFDRLSLNESERHEMMLHRSVRLILEKMFLFWDATEGEGVLGLRGLPSLTGEETAVRAESPNDLLHYIEDLFAQQKERRGWSSTPVLLNLEL